LPTWRGALQLVRVATSRGRARLEAHRGLLFPASWAPDPEPLYAGLEADYGTPPDPAARRAQLRAILRHDTRHRLHELAGLPTLVVRGGADILIRPSRSDALHAAIPGARLLRIDEAGHGLIRQTPGPLNAALLEHYRAADEAG
jgi:pimeloyl-ACP methyl ester carboxylesterase